jgi:hypothetical protein
VRRTVDRGGAARQVGGAATRGRARARAAMRI